MLRVVKLTGGVGTGRVAEALRAAPGEDASNYGESAPSLSQKQYPLQNGPDLYGFAHHAKILRGLPY